jgi:2,3-bisphosphoglycerate-dependent phosphoglycerate mutase
MTKLVLVRHGQSVWNLQNRFTGWIDVPLSPKGIREAKQAGKILADYSFDVIYTSTLIRAHHTLYEIMALSKKISYYRFNHNENKWYKNFTRIEKEDKNSIDVEVSDALNERFYGDLQGLNKDETRKKYGEEQVHIWRRSFDVPPPNGESLKDTSNRTLPYYKKKILKDLKNGKDVLVVAHGNSLRSMIMEIEKMTPEEILEFNLPTGIPRVYEFDKNMKMKKVSYLK